MKWAFLQVLLVGQTSEMKMQYFRISRWNGRTPCSVQAGLAAIGAALVVLGCGGSGGEDVAPPPFALTRATCGSGDRAETGLAGQIPMAERTAGFQGYNCNLQKTSAVQPSRGANLFEQFVSVTDRTGRTCGYMGPGLGANPGTTVVELTDPSKAVETAVLTTPAMQAPAEGLRVHAGRGLLVSGYGASWTAPDGDVSHGFDIYDVGTDCRHPQLLFTTKALLFPSDSLGPPDPVYASLEGGKWKPTEAVYGHEGAFAPDGLTYYISDNPHQAYHAIDLIDPTNPKLISTFVNPGYLKTKTGWKGGPHGLSISNDGNRGYLTSVDTMWEEMTPETGDWFNGFVIVDTSEIQSRKPNAKMRVIAEKYSRDGSAAQMTVPMRINGKQYLLLGSEGGHGSYTPAGNKQACAAGKTPFGLAKIYDIENEADPKLVSDLILEVNDPKNCAMFKPEMEANQNLFLYDVHMCSVDNRDNTTTVACSHFNSGIRVYDVRDPVRPREIAYYNPPAMPGKQPGWCGAIPILDATRGMVYSTCVDTGTVALKFTNGVWPFPESTTPPDRQL